MARCPFYGRRWPERSFELLDVGGHECALDFTDSDRCQMERDGRTVNYFSCPVALAQTVTLSVVKDRVRFPEGGTLAEWEERNR